MKNDIILRGALANTSGQASTKDLLRFLKEKLPEGKFYKLTPQPGTIMAAAFDWQIILEATKSTIVIGQALWSACKRFVKPIREEKRNDAFLFVAIKNERKEFVQFTIGKEYKDEKTFVREFSEKVEKIRMLTDSADLDYEKREIKESEVWKEI